MLTYMDLQSLDKTANKELCETYDAVLTQLSKASFYLRRPKLAEAVEDYSKRVQSDPDLLMATRPKNIKDAVLIVPKASSEDLDLLQAFEKHSRYEVYKYSIYPNPDQTMEEIFPHTLGWSYCVFKKETSHE